MRRTFTKKDLHTGDIIETRNGERGVVILELDCILYQEGGLDIFEEVFTEDLYIFYNAYQEEWHLKLDKKKKDRGRYKEEDLEPIIIIPEMDLNIHSRCGQGQACK